MKANTKRDAARAAVKAHNDYKRLSADVARHLAAIEAGLKGHAERAAADPTNWGFAGDLGALAAELANVSDRLNQTGEYAR